MREDKIIILNEYFTLSESFIMRITISSRSFILNATSISFDISCAWYSSRYKNFSLSSKLIRKILSIVTCSLSMFFLSVWLEFDLFAVVDSDEFWMIPLSWDFFLIWRKSSLCCEFIRIYLFTWKSDLSSLRHLVMN